MTIDDRKQRGRLADYPGRTGVRIFLGSAFLLTGVGAAVVERTWWAAPWVIVGGIFLAQGIGRWRQRRR